MVGKFWDDSDTRGRGKGEEPNVVTCYECRLGRVGAEGVEKWCGRRWRECVGCGVG